MWVTFREPQIWAPRPVWPPLPPVLPSVKPKPLAAPANGPSQFWTATSTLDATSRQQLTMATLGSVKEVRTYYKSLWDIRGTHTTTFSLKVNPILELYESFKYWSQAKM